MLASRRENGSESTAEAIRRPKKLDRAEAREKYQSLDAETTSLLHGICGRLGHLPSVPATYILSIDFGEALKDLARLLSGDDGPVMVKLGEMQVVMRHLAPMLIVVSRDRFPDELATLLNVLILLSASEGEANRASTEALLDLRRQYKRAFESVAIMEALLNLAISSLAPTPQSAPHDGEFLKRVLMLVRNLLAIPDASEQYSATNVSLASSFGRQERLVASMQNARLLEFLMVAAGACNDQRDHRLFASHVPLLVEIFHCLFRVYDPDSIAAMQSFDKDGPQGCATEEAIQKEVKIKRPIRHGRFSGSVVVRLSTGEDYMMSSSRFDEALTLDPGKRVQHRPKKMNINDLGENAVRLRSSERLVLFKVVLEFIRESFSELVGSCFDRFDLQNPDAALEWNVLGLTTWMLRFARRVLAVSGSAAVLPTTLTFDHLYGAVDAELMTKIGLALRRYLTEKQHPLLFAAVLYYREALRFIDLMAHMSEAPHVVEHSRALLTEFFYRHHVVSILRVALHHSQRYSLKMLSMLVEANHVLLKLLKSYCASKALVFVSTTRQTTRGGSDEEKDVEDTTAAGQERQFFFEQFIQDYGTENIVDAHVRLLRNAHSLDPSVNRFVAMMMQRIVVDAQMPRVFHRVSVMDAIHGCLVNRGSLWRRRNSDLLKVCTVLATSFLQELRQDPTMIVAAFFNPGYAARQTPLRDLSIDPQDSIQPARLSEHWSLDEKIRWLVRSLVDTEQSSAVSWLSGKFFDAAASRTTRAPEEDEADPERTGIFEDYYFYAQTDSLKAAFSNAQMQTLLVEMGVEPPCGENRSWRLPALVPASDIIERAHIMQVCLRDALDADVQPCPTTLVTSIARRSSNPDGPSYGSDAASPSSRVIEDDQETDEAMEASDGADPGSLSPPRAITSRWQSLKRSNFFLTHPDAPQDDHHHSDSVHDHDREMDTVIITRAKRPPLMIASDDE